jgi:hypothetical protein
MCLRRKHHLLNWRASHDHFNAVPAYETAVSAMILAEVSIADPTEPAPDATINAPVRGGSTPPFATMASKYWPRTGGAGAVYGVTPVALVVCPQAAPTGASPR